MLKLSKWYFLCLHCAFLLFITFQREWLRYKNHILFISSAYLISHSEKSNKFQFVALFFNYFKITLKEMESIMKKLALIIVLALCIQSIVSAQSCLPDGILFTTQAAIDNFQSNYPDCNEIEGDVTIEGDGITNLNGLGVLTSIGGSLQFVECHSLTILAGLNNITSIGGNLIIGASNNLIGLGGLHNLTSIGGNLTINGGWAGHPALTSLTGLHSLTSIGSGLSIINNSSLTNLKGLDNLTSIGNHLAIEGAAALVNLTGLENITSIVGGLYIGSYDIYGGRNHALASLSGLENVTSIGGDLLVSHCSSLTSLTGLENVTSIGGNITIGISKFGGNWALTSLTGLEGLTSIDGSLTINGSTSFLTSLTGLDNVTSIEGSVKIYNNDSLTSLTGLDNLSFINGNLALGIGYEYLDHGNPSLTNLTGLNNLTSIGGGLYIDNNDSLTNLTGLDNLTSIGEDLKIGRYGGTDNPNLTNLTGLESLTSIGGELLIYGNDTMESLSGLEGLTSIGGNLEIGSNTSLISISGLQSVTSIGGSLFIYDNDTLGSLTGVDNIGAYSITDLVITNNASLSNCEVQLLCDYLSNPYGSVDIYNNATGCNNPSEIANACGITLACLPFGNFHLFTQSQIDDFSTNYPNCTGLEGDVTIYGDDITNLNGLSVVTSIGEDLNIYSNDSLPNLTGLENVTFIGGYLWIHNNNTLTSLTGLDNIIADSIENLFIDNNTSLSACEVQSICDYLTNPNGDIYIHDNATGCNGQYEILAACETVSVNELILSDNLNTHPNPFSTSTTIEFELSQPGTVRITIYNQFGAQVEVIEQRQAQGLNQAVWTPGHLPNGIYYFRLQAGEKLASGKMMLMR